jgi:hypothetical protein
VSIRNRSGEQGAKATVWAPAKFKTALGKNGALIAGVALKGDVVKIAE